MKNHKPFVGIPDHVIGSEDNTSINVLTGQGIYVIEKIQFEETDKAINPAAIIREVQQRLGLTQDNLFERLSLLKGSI